MSLTRTAIIRIAARAPLASAPRYISTSLPRKAQDGGPDTTTADPSGTPRPTQGHTTTKSHRLDVQNDNAKAGQNTKDAAGGSSDAQPIDAASMNGGMVKGGTEGTGAFKDQVGGQQGSSGGDVKKGGQVETPSGGWMGKVSKTLGGNKAFHTSTRTLSSPRQPVESELAGEQNEHLKHKDPKASDSGKGNAAPEPHLPSQSGGSSAGKQGDGVQSQSAEQTKSNPAQSGKASGAPKGFAAYHSSAVRLGEKEREAGYAGSRIRTERGEKAGKDIPSEALPPNLESNYNRAETAPPAPPNMTPSSEAEYSSTAVDPPNQALKHAVKQGGQAGELDLSRNAQPSGEVGKKGVKEAWKDRK